jgi:flavin-dependent dehydrogenase
MDMSNKGDDNRRFVIVGGGPAGLSCAETLR